MKHLVKYLKPFRLQILIIIALLFVQAICELSLPDYMSNIVNTGIQQGGIDSSIPNVVRRSEMDKILLFIDVNQKEKITSYYELISKDNLTDKEYNEYLKKYPTLKNESIYKLKNNKKNIKDIEITMAKAILAVYGIESGTVSGFDDMHLPEGVDPFTVLSTLPQSQLENIIEKMNNKLTIMPEAMINQSATIYIKGEYKNIGIDVDATEIFCRGIK